MSCEHGDASEDPAKEAFLKAPFEYVKRVPGKKIRTKLTEAFNKWLNIDEDVLINITSIVESLHNASLLVDDIEDDSLLRRGKPVAHKIYGIPRTLNAANYVYMLSLQECIKMENPKAVEIFAEEMLELHRGQGKEIFWRDTIQCPTEDEYNQMVLQKTGGLFSLAVRLMELYSKNKFNFKPLIRKLALYFQVRDDYMNLCSSRYGKEKGFAEDVTEGKFSLPVIFALRDHINAAAPFRDDEVLVSSLLFKHLIEEMTTYYLLRVSLGILQQRPTNYEVKAYFVNLLRERGSLKKTMDRIQYYYQEVIDETAVFGGNDKLIEVLENLHNALKSVAIEEEKLLHQEGH
ncbi:unnamed protein product [Enterobius vermicularis]|uniref:Geranylgeranyl pyrophosphate synthase n=1 Tax=Enterobius vermicularis TaxID=51028 RepID=A0A0N4V9U4_ENTVE|nr:unnamed protein product [Enterobius vermicularis]